VIPARGRFTGRATVTIAPRAQPNLCPASSEGAGGKAGGQVVRERTGWIAAALVVAVALSVGVVGVVMFADNAPARPAQSGSLSRGQLIRLTQRVRCPLPPPTPAPGRPTERFRAVAAVLCEPVVRQGSVRIVRHATGSGVAQLQHAVMTARRTAPTAQCFVSLLPTPGLVLLDASGHTLTPTFPRDACGLPDPVFRAALARHAWIRLAG
jgi:hypothetical protein